MPAATKPRPEPTDPVVGAPEGEEVVREDVLPTSTPEPVRPQTREPLVDLDADERETVRFGGKLYELKSISEFGLGQQHRLNRQGREFHQLFSSQDELSETDEQRLEMLQEEIFEKVFVGAKTVKAKLTPGQKSQVILGFILAPLARSAALMQLMQQMNQEAREGDPTTGS